MYHLDVVANDVPASEQLPLLKFKLKTAGSLMKAGKNAVLNKDVLHYLLVMLIGQKQLEDQEHHYQSQRFSQTVLDTDPCIVTQKGDALCPAVKESKSEVWKMLYEN